VAVKVVVLAAIVCAGAWTVWRSVHVSPWLHVEHIVVTGNRHLSTGEVLSRLDGVAGSSLLALDLAGCRQRVLSSPWVAEVTVRRVLPDTLQVAVTERQPLAIARAGTVLTLVDADGVVIDEFGPAYDGYDLPIIDGLAGGGGRAGSGVRAEHARVTSRLLSDLSADQALLRRVSQVDVTDPRNVVVWLQDDPARLLVGDREFRKRLAGYVEVRDALRARVPEMDAVDLRFDRRVFVTPAAGHDAGAMGPRAGRAPRLPS
jgi:cell division protein FtsQ